MKALHGEEPGDLDLARNVLQRKARDHSRTPVQWNDGPNAGFCAADVQPWMRVMDDFKQVNAETQAKTKRPDDLTVLQFWKRGLENRKKHKDTLVYGSFELLDDQHSTIFAYRRSSSEEVFVVVLNFHGKHTVWTIPEHCKVDTWVAGNYTAGKPEKPTNGTIALRPWEGLIGKCRLLVQ